MLTTGDLAKLFHVSSQTVINWLDQGRVPFERIGTGPRRIREIDALRYVRQMQINPETLESGMYQDILRIAGQDPTLQPQGPFLLIVGKEGRILGGSEGAFALMGKSLSELVEEPYNQFIQLTDAQTRMPVILHRVPAGPNAKEMIWQKSLDQVSAGRLMCTPYFETAGVVGGWTLVLSKESS